MKPFSFQSRLNYRIFISLKNSYFKSSRLQSEVQSLHPILTHGKSILAPKTVNSLKFYLQKRKVVISEQ